MRHSTIPLISAFILALAAGGAQAQDGVEEAFQQWRSNCPAPGENTTRPCVIYTQNGLATDAGPLGARIALGPDSSQQMALVIELIHAQQSTGFGLGVDGQEPLLASLPSCSGDICRGSITGATANDLIEQFGAGDEATISYIAADQRQVRIDLSLIGFTAAYNSITQ
ncbi:invasion associated locus B family protein [Inquilinus sp. CAU 1745]|uniref:invasion associated locus B family protein n=1 Tax=Inquilinus sp. CAU 1745 TaxID=3140369 RepID=UPI00325A7372